VFVGYTGVVHEASSSAPTDTQAAVPEAAAARDAAPTMLVVDDQRAVRRSIRRMFDRLGWKVAEADCAHAALSLLAGQCRDAELVVADVVMPGGMDGIALAERIRSQYPGIAVVLVSGHRPQGWKASTEILEKPFSEQALLDAARRSGLRAELCARITT